MSQHAANTQPLTVLRVDSSGRLTDSATRELGDALLRQLADGVSLNVVERDLAAGVPFVDSAWIDANNTPAEERTAAQRAALAYSDALVEELEAADVLVLGVPIYNFGVPGAFKAWIDLILRARRTFRYTPNGPVGMLRDRPTYVVTASGGVAIDSAADFATPYLRHVLAFIGITNVEVIAAERINQRGDAALASARRSIAGLTMPAFNANDTEHRV